MMLRDVLFKIQYLVVIPVLTAYAANAAELTYSSGVLSDGQTFQEAGANNGTIDNSTPILITLSGDTFTGVINGDLVADAKVNITNLPANLIAVFRKTSSTTVEVTLTGTAASHIDSDDVSNLTFEFLDTAFSGGSASSVTNYLRSNMIIDFDDPLPRALAYTAGILGDGTTFQEAGANNGTIDNSSPIVITLTNDTFDDLISRDLVADAKVNVTNIPTGLTPVFTLTSSTTVEVTLTGTAASHTSADNISNLTVTFQDSAFTGGLASAVSGYSRNDMVITFDDPMPRSLAYTGGILGDGTTFQEAAVNNGTIDNSSPIVITLTGDTFTGNNGQDFYIYARVIYSNMPSGLSAAFTRTSPTTIAVTLTGSATSHADSDDVSNLTFELLDTAFSGGDASSVSGYQRSNLVIDFMDAAARSLAYSGGPLGDGQTFQESSADDGTIDNTSPIVVTLTGDTFQGVNGEDFVPGGRAIVNNRPFDLTAVVKRTSDTTVEVTLTGTAASHTNNDDVSNLTVEFTNQAFDGFNASSVFNYRRTDLIVDFIEGGAPVLAYDTTVFHESVVNDGSIEDSSPAVVTLSDETFTGSDGDNFVSSGKVSVGNLPAGLSISLVRTDTTHVSLRFHGAATSHSDSDDVSNLALTFQDSAFTGGDASVVSGAARSDLVIDFIDNSAPTLDGGGYSRVSGGGSSFTAAVYTGNVLGAGMVGMRAYDTNTNDTVTLTVSLNSGASTYDGTVYPVFSSPASGISSATIELTTAASLDGTGELVYSISANDGTDTTNGALVINVNNPPPRGSGEKRTIFSCGSAGVVVGSGSGFRLFDPTSVLMCLASLRLFFNPRRS